MWRASEIEGYGISATDGLIGSVQDWLFDDHDWIVRWVVVDTGTWLPGKKIVLPASVCEAPDMKRRVIRAPLTRAQVEQSPSLDEHAPVSRQNESDVYNYYGWTPYWTPAYMAPAPPPITPPAESPAERGDPRLRSVNEVTGYYIRASDGDIGHVEELLIDDVDWTVRYLVIDTRNWLPGKAVLVSPQSVGAINWSDEQVEVNLTRAQVETSPPYDPSVPVDRNFEMRLHSHYGLPPYWG